MMGDKKRGLHISKRMIWALVFMLIAVLFLLDIFSFGRDVKYQNERGFVFGTTYSITYSNAEKIDLKQNINNAFDVVNNSLSMFNPNSVISHINNNVDTVPDAPFMIVWDKAQEVSINSNGCFDMTVAPLVDLWGFGLKKRATVTPEQVDSVMPYIGWGEISIANGVVMKNSPSIRIDASAIAKGFACDVVADTLAAYGCTDWCVEIGGEVVAGGVNPKGDAWRIGINKPVEDSLSIVNEIQDIAYLTNAGMATSGNYRNYYEEGGKKYSHTIDPRTGYPVRHSLLSATIIAADCMTADAWATACMVAGFETSKQWITDRSDISGYLIYEQDGEYMTWVSDDFPIK
ncbi:MAG: FAD:protein FMN transferase [bacterium]